MKNFQRIYLRNEKRRCLQLQLMKKIRWSRFMKPFIKVIGRSLTQHLNRTQKLCIFLMVMTVVITSSIWNSRTIDVEDMKIKSYNVLEEDLKDIVIENKGAGCVMPQLDPFDKKTMEYEKTLPTACEEKDWVKCVLDECFVAQSIREKLKDVHCVYRDIVYVNDFKHHMQPPTRLAADKKYRLRRSDHVEVSCLGRARLSPKPLYWAGHKAGIRQVPLRKHSSGRARLSVLMLCLDSMSKNGFIRRMPRSYNALKEMGALILNGYNIVGDGSSAALFPILTGSSKETRKRFAKGSFDEDSFIFRRLSKIGYRTALFEDFPVFGAPQWTFGGFQDQPTDHYLLPLLIKHYGNTSRINRSFCMGDIPLYRALLNLTHQFFQLNGNRFSFTFITDISRDNFNLSYADKDLALFLHRLHQGGELKDTVLFVMGNHGSRTSSIRETPQGKHEERLPLMAIVVPDVLKQTRPDAVAAMEANVDVLTTPFDIHSTVTDILGMEYLRNRYKVPGSDMERGLTLMEPAGVVPYWCACADWHPVSPLDSIYKDIGNLVADYINSVTAVWRPQCITRKLVSIEHVLLLLPTNIILKYKKKLTGGGYFGKFGEWFQPRSNYYQVKIIMRPGRAVFEATLKHFQKGDYFAIAEEDITRLNAYANESACIKLQPPYLHKYCYCR